MIGSAFSALRANREDSKPTATLLEAPHDIRSGSLLVWHMECWPRSHSGHAAGTGISRAADSQSVLAVHRCSVSLVYGRDTHFKLARHSSFWVGRLLGSPVALCGGGSPSGVWFQI